MNTTTSYLPSMKHLLTPLHALAPPTLLEIQIQPSILPSRAPFSARPSGAHRSPENLSCPRRAKAPPDPGIVRSPLKRANDSTTSTAISDHPNKVDNFELPCKDEELVIASADNDDSVWSPEELEAISALFERRNPQKPAKLVKERPLPLPLPYKIRPLQTPKPKHHIRLAARSVLSLRAPLSNRVCKNPDALVGIAREIAALPADASVSEVLDRWAPFLRKGSLSLTIRELGHLGMLERALQTLCWAQKHRPALFPDDRILASTVEVLARYGQLKLEGEMGKHLNLASRSVVEAMARGFIRAGHLNRARKLLLLAKNNKRTLDPSIYAKLILEAGKNPDKHKLALTLLEELADREDFSLKPQDCTAIMKVCIRLGKFEVVESLFEWFKASGRSPTVVMYTTVIYSWYCSKNYQKGLALVWEMEELNCLLDLPAYRVVIRLCVALNDLARAVRYFSRLKEAGFFPTYDIYCDMIKAYAASGRLAKCRQICKEVEMAGLKLDKGTLSLLSEIEGEKIVPIS